MNVAPEIAPLLRADSFLRGAGVIGDVQKNNLVLTTLCACPKLKRVSFDIDVKKKMMIVYLELGWWNFWITSRPKMVDTLLSIYGEYLSEYDFTFRFRRYGRTKHK